MLKRLTRTGNSLALVLDRPLLERTQIDGDTPLEVSTDGNVIVIAPVRERKRAERVRSIVTDADDRFAGVFKLLAD